MLAYHCRLFILSQIEPNIALFTGLTASQSHVFFQPSGRLRPSASDSIPTLITVHSDSSFSWHRRRTHFIPVSTSIIIVLLFTHFVYPTAQITTHRFSFTIHSTSIQALGVDIAAFSAMPNESEVEWVAIHYLYFVQLASVRPP